MTSSRPAFTRAAEAFRRPGARARVSLLHPTSRGIRDVVKAPAALERLAASLRAVHGRDEVNRFFGGLAAIHHGAQVGTLVVDISLGYAAFAPWFVTKLAVGRDKDRYPLVEVLKRATPLQVSDMVTRVRQLHPSYLAEFERLVRAAEEEKGQESW